MCVEGGALKASDDVGHSKNCLGVPVPPLLVRKCYLATRARGGPPGETSTQVLIPVVLSGPWSRDDLPYILDLHVSLLGVLSFLRAQVRWASVDQCCSPRSPPGKAVCISGH